MRFMTIYKPAKKAPTTGPSPEHMAEMGKFIDEMTKSGTLISTGALSGNRATVRMEGGKVSVIDGPFAESKEMIAGFALLQHGSKEEAIEGVKRFLGIAGDGESELREVYEMDDFPVADAEQPDGWRENETKFREAEAAARKSPLLPPAPPGKQRFMVMLKADHRTEGELDPAGGDAAVMEEMGALMTEMAKAGKLLGGEGLKPSSRGARVRLEAGKVTVVDGPFAETKELVAGFSTLEVASKEEAIDFARRMLDIHVRGAKVDRGEIEVLQLF